MITKITDEQMNSFVRSAAASVDETGKYSGENFSHPFALGVLMSKITMALNDAKMMKQLRREIAAVK